MRRVWRGWVQLTSRRERGTTLAVFRVAVALVILYSLLSITAAGLVEVLWFDAAYGGYRSLPHVHWLPQALGGARPQVVWPLLGLAFAGATGMLVGIGGRLPIGLTALAYHPLVTLNSDTYGGYEFMITNAVWLLLVGNATATLSLDCRRRTGRWTSDAQVAAWPRYVLVFQLVVVYTSTALYKLSLDWVPGGTYSALYWVFQDPTWCRYDLRTVVASAFRVTQLATAVTWFFEIGATALLLVFYYRATAGRSGRIRRAFNRFDLRWLFLAIGASLHVGILVLLNVGPFSWISLAYYLCLWTPEELEGLARTALRR